jgi:hypothetical protein
MYTVGRGPVKVKDAKAARRKPKKQVDTKLIIEVDDEVDNEVEDGDI